ncbi:NEDD4-binding protein 2 [Aulostomus maculatus]
MPRRKKNGQSPARVPGGEPEGESRLPLGFDSAMATNFSSCIPVFTSDREKIVQSMTEMFSHLDPDVIHIVLSECDFKVENAMDSLLELSVAAEHAAPIPSPVSGFEQTAAALLSPHHLSEPWPEPDPRCPSQPFSSPPSTSIMTEELDLLLDQELQKLTAQEDKKKDQPNSQDTSAGPPSSFSAPPFPQRVLPELLQSSLEPGPRGPSAEQPCPEGGLVQLTSGASSPLDQLSIWAVDTSEGQQSEVDFKHLMTETAADNTKTPLNLAASGRPSAFQVYKKKEKSNATSDEAAVTPPDDAAGGARPKMTSWNLDSPVFSPRIGGNQDPCFITPVAPSTWPSQLRHPSPWLGRGPVNQAPLKPSATIPKSWAVPAAPQYPSRSNRLRLEGKVLVLLRGAPGSGKTTLARALRDHNPGGVVLSTDDYFTRNGVYHFDPTLLGEAHEWNHKRANEAFERGAYPIIIDNTNLRCWEMKPYVVQALKHNYKVLFREPDTWWKNKPRELERRTTHNVPVETIRRMLDGYERFVTVHSIMGSLLPEFKQRLLENSSLQPVNSETPHPDLVREPRLTERCQNSSPHLFSSLPDVSSLGHSTEALSKDGSHKSTEALNQRPTERPGEKSEMFNEDMDLGVLDAELDAQLELRGDQRIPDCIVESVMNEDHRGEEIPVAFFESIAQRVRRERPSRRSDFDRANAADLVKDTNQIDNETSEKDKEKEEAEGAMPNMLDFEGDWPSQGSLEQRQVKRRERHAENNVKADDAAEVLTGPGAIEFQKLLDLIQTGVSALHTDSSHSPSLSSTSGDEPDREVETGGQFEESHGRSSSHSEEREQSMTRVNNSRGELPDCVLDWKASDSCIIEVPKIESEAGKTTDINDKLFHIAGERESVDLKSTSHSDSLASSTADAVVMSENTDAKGGGSADGTGALCHTEKDASNRKERTDRETTAQLDSSRSGEVCPVCEGSVEESSVLTATGQERKQRQGRRSGKQCKLALTFTQNCSAASQEECPSTTDQRLNGSQNNVDTELQSNPQCKTNFNLKPNDSFTESKSEAHQPSSPSPLVDMCCPTQTEPQDFALLWRLNHQDNPVDPAVAACTNDITVLSGDSSRFVPELSSVVSAAVAVHPSGHKEVPYRVVHEKSTQVEDREFRPTQDRLESLRILSRHFKLVSFDTLEDLYDKCHHDLEWTTNLLLDSGERFFRDEDGVEDAQSSSSLCGALRKESETRKSHSVLHKLLSEDLTKTHPSGGVEVVQQPAYETVSKTGESSDCTSFRGGGSPSRNKNHLDTLSDSVKMPQTEVSLLERGEICDVIKHEVTTEHDLESGACAGSTDDGVIVEESRVEIEDEIASMDEIQRLLETELEEIENEAKRKRKEERGSRHLDFQSVELRLPTELALQLTELFGPVGVDLGTCSFDDYEVQIDLNLAKLLHQKWKETIQEKQRQATLSFHLLQESSVHWGETQGAKPYTRDQTQTTRLLVSTDGYQAVGNQPETQTGVPFMDHWNVSQPHVSLRDIIKEEQALQENMEKTRKSRADLDRRDGATLLKENQLFSLFPTIDRHFLQDIFRDHNYSLTQTELFLRSLLDEEPVKTVIAPEAPLSDHRRAASREREKRQQPLESTMPPYQDTQDPDYADFRAEANLQRERQLESFSKAKEAYNQGRKEVASFYTQQGQMHGLRMREANHRAAVQIFERVNSSLLPKNILDLHGLHVNEALMHLAQVLKDKSREHQQGLCRPQLSVITGRGNHSQGGVARIRPAVKSYLTSNHYRFTEPTQGLLSVSLK